MPHEPEGSKEEQKKQEDLNEIFEMLDTEVDILYGALNKRGGEFDTNYADKIIRGQLEDIAESIEAMSRTVGSGEAITPTTPSELMEED